MSDNLTKYFVQMDDGKTSYEISATDYDTLQAELGKKTQEIYEIMPIVEGDIRKSNSFLNTRIIIINKILSLTKQVKVLMHEEILMVDEIEKQINLILEKEDQYIEWEYDRTVNKLILAIEDTLVGISEECFFNLSGTTQRHIAESIQSVLETLKAERIKNNIKT